ncbi:hypothetical protein DAMA08_032090 [Martiniozyma asiatica (nom. inval.)]|nr:hypothetical protein DAMA08_032090 [Martiniozyma asiatica]
MSERIVDRTGDSKSENEIYVTLMYYGPATDMTGINGEKICISKDTTLVSILGGFSDCYSKEFFEFVTDNCNVTINDEYVDKDDHSLTLQEGDEICIIPPVSSG